MKLIGDMKPFYGIIQIFLSECLSSKELYLVCLCMIQDKETQCIIN